ELSSLLNITSCIPRNCPPERSLLTQDVYNATLIVLDPKLVRIKFHLLVIYGLLVRYN
ncbi:hypothetical protein COCC4DRAFT_154538, partial [Bipolaris maydis ATCC 48331]